MVRYYHYTSTKNAQGIKNDGVVKKGNKNIILTTLEPEYYYRDQILSKVYGRNFDRNHYGNRADWVVVVDSSKLDSNKLHKKNDDVYEYPENIRIDKNDVTDKPKYMPQSSGSTQWPTNSSPVNSTARYYHYTSTKNGKNIQNDGVLRKRKQNIILTTLEPKNYTRDKILLRVYGRNYDRHHYGNRADWVVVVDASKLDSNKLLKRGDDVYEYPEDIRIGRNDVMDKPKCIPQSSGSSQWSSNMDGNYLYHYTNWQGADAIKKAGFIKQSGQSGAFGPGAYMTDLKPTDFFREDIIKNNYGGIANAFKGRADYVVKVNKNNLNLSKLHKVGVAVTGQDRSIFVYNGEIRVSPQDVCDKPKCYRSL